jgi:hypothetical protein
MYPLEKKKRPVLTVDTAPMTDLDHIDDQVLVFNRVNYSIYALTYSIPIYSRKFFAPSWSRILCQGLDPGDDTPSLFNLSNSLNFTYRRRLNLNLISCHYSLDP